MPRINPSKIFFLLISLIFSSVTYSRNAVWIDQFTIWSDAAMKSPNKARPYNDIGNVYLIQKRFNDAIRMYQKAILLKPDFYEVHYNIGIIYAKYGMWSAAIKEYQKALERGGSGEYLIHYKLGDAFAGKGVFEDAIREYKISIRLKPDDPDAYYGLARVYSMKMEKEAAVDYLTKAIKNGFKNYEIMTQDKGLDNIRGDERFKLFLRRRDDDRF